MGMFDWLFGRNPKVCTTNKIWLTDEVRLQALCAEVETHSKIQPVLIVAHFAEDLCRLQDRLNREHIPFQLSGPRTTARDFARRMDVAPQPQVLLSLSQDLDPGSLDAEASATPRNLFVAVLGRHFLLPRDERVLTFYRQLGGACEITIFRSRTRCSKNLVANG